MDELWTLSATERRVATVMSRFGIELHIESIKRDTAMAQDAHIDGIDVDEFASAIEQEFGPIAREIPWLRFSDQRASARGCGVALFPFWLIGRIISRPHGESIMAAPGEVAYPRLTVEHIAMVIDEGRWFDPEDMSPASPGSLTA